MAEAAVQSDSEVHRVLKDISDLGLEKYASDLDTDGYTVIPPEIASPNGLAERMLEACLDIAERRNGVRPDLETGSTHANLGIEATATPRRMRIRARGIVIGLEERSVDTLCPIPPLVPVGTARPPL